MRASGRSVLLTTRITGRCAVERLAQHEPGLRQRTLRGVDQQQHAVDHGQAALDLAAEVGVTRRVDDVDDRHAAVGVVAVHGGVLGQDRDALFLLQVTGVHQAFDRVVAAMGQGARLTQHRVDEGRLPMVDVCHDGDISEIGQRLHVRLSQCKRPITKTRDARHLKPSKLVGPQTEEEVLPQQAAVQALSGRGASGPQGRTQRHTGQGTGEGVQAGPVSASAVPYADIGAFGVGVRGHGV